MIKQIFVLIAIASIVIVPTGSQQAFACSVTDTISTGNNSIGVAVNSNTNMIYVANWDDDTVTVIDGSDNSVVTTINVGDEPFGIAVNPVTNMVYVSNAGDFNVTVIDGSDNSIVTTINDVSFDDPGEIGVNFFTDTVYVVNRDFGVGLTTITVIDGSTNAVSTTIPVGQSPRGIDVNVVTNTIYVSSIFDTLYVIDGSTNGVSTIAVAGQGNDVVVNTTTNLVYVATNGNITIVNGGSNTVIDTIAVTPGIFATLAINTLLNTIYSTNSVGDILVIDGSDNSFSTITPPNSPRVMAVNTATETLYVSTFDGVLMVVGDDSPPTVTVPSDITENASLTHFTDGGTTVTFAVSANDACDGSITPSCDATSDSTLFQVTTTLVTCTATDSAGNEGSATFNVTIEDNTPPEITLLGDPSVEIIEGETYVDAGATAYDNVDGDITANIVTVNPVDDTTPGVYVVTYNVDDAATNSATEVTRTVTVLSIADAKADLIQLVDDTTDEKKVENALMGPLKQGIRIATDNNPNNDDACCGKLNEFLDTLNAKEEAGQISTVDADNLEAAAQRILDAIGCPLS